MFYNIVGRAVPKTGSVARNSLHSKTSPNYNNIRGYVRSVGAGCEYYCSSLSRGRVRSRSNKMVCQQCLCGCQGRPHRCTGCTVARAPRRSVRLLVSPRSWAARARPAEPNEQPRNVNQKWDHGPKSKAVASAARVRMLVWFLQFHQEQMSAVWDVTTNKQRVCVCMLRARVCVCGLWTLPAPKPGCS